MITIGKINSFRRPPYSPTICPRCLGMLPIGYPGALSRVDNKTEICSPCGTDEAMTDYLDHYLAPISKWPIRSLHTAADLQSS